MKSGRLGFLDFGRSKGGGKEPDGSTRGPVPDRAVSHPVSSDRSETHPAWYPFFEGALDGKRLESERGTYFLSRSSYSFHEESVGYPIASFLECQPEALSWLGRDSRLAAIRPEEMLFLDCETTGLAGGTGTKAFLVGLARIDTSVEITASNSGEPRPLVVEQLFLPDYDSEDAFLEALCTRLLQARAIVSFNGKCFDLPLIQTRLTLGGFGEIGMDLPHLDLLHPARRVWKKRVGSCALSSLEVSILGLPRENDTPGWLIPSLYFDFLRTGRLSQLESVFRHNRLDLLGLVALTGKLTGLVQECDRIEHGLDLLGIGSIFEEVGALERSISAYERALLLGLEPGAASEGRARLGALLKRLGDRRAVDIWRSALESGVVGSVSAMVELAKFYEHQERDYTQAIEMTRRALRLLEIRPDLRGRDEESIEELMRRWKRLEGKIARSRPGASAPVFGRDKARTKSGVGAVVGG